ncbi:MAG: PKD domain-containing protein [Bryobacterales bacterium]|nr:PKD domain-containing protein [Bryobacterales bacterium]
MERPGVEYKVFQFPADQIPSIDGRAGDWAQVPADYAIGIDQLKETVKGLNFKVDQKDLDVTVKVGWVKGLNRLYFLYEAYDDYWDFRRTDRHNDIFELVVDGDLSGGPLIASLHPNAGIDKGDAFFQFHGVHAQNYHIFTPAPDRDWAFVWGAQPWIKHLPYANAAYRYNFRHGEPGKLTLEFFITPFDYAPYDGPSRAVESKLSENKVIGMSWAVLDYDDADAKDYDGFWNLSHKTTMFGNASDLVAFRLMPVEAALRKPLQAGWTHKIVSMERRVVAFQDESEGARTRWLWSFGDGTTSSEQHPQHTYQKAGEYIVTLEVEGPSGVSRWTKVRDLVLR